MPSIIFRTPARRWFAVVMAISAPSSLAVQAADELGVAVLGFTRGGATNIYAHAERIAATI